MRVAYCQFEPTFGQVKQNLEVALDQVWQVECDLLVFPELAFSGYQFISQEEVHSLSEPIHDGPTTKRLIELARHRSMFVVAGLPEHSGGRYFNSAVFVGPQGVVGVYRKTHLFYEETLWFSPGDTGFQVWDIGSTKVGILICYDWIYPEAARTLALKGAEVLCHPSNLILPHCPDAMVTRCLENRVFSITANRIGEEERGQKERLTFIGQSEIVSPFGRIVHRSPKDQTEVFVAEIHVEEARQKSLNPYNHLFRDRTPHFYSVEESIRSSSSCSQHQSPLTSKVR